MKYINDVSNYYESCLNDIERSDVEKFKNIQRKNFIVNISNLPIIQISVIKMYLKNMINSVSV